MHQTKNYFTLFFILLALTLCLGCNIVLAKESETNTRENILKAKVINSISRFTLWPNNLKNSHHNICIIGTNESLSTALSVFFDNENKDKYTILSINLKSLSDLESCQILFIPNMDISKLKNIIAHLNKKPILLFSDSPGFAELGVHVNLYIDNNKVRFEVNHNASKIAGLDFSSHLLRLAKIVKGDA